MAEMQMQTLAEQNGYFQRIGAYSVHSTVKHAQPSQLNIYYVKFESIFLLICTCFGSTNQNTEFSSPTTTQCNHLKMEKSHETSVKAWWLQICCKIVDWEVLFCLSIPGPVKHKDIKASCGPLTYWKILLCSVKHNF